MGTLIKRWLPSEAVPNHHKCCPVKRMRVFWLRHQHQCSLTKSLGLVDLPIVLSIPRSEQAIGRVWVHENCRLAHRKWAPRHCDPKGTMESSHQLRRAG